MGLSCEKSRYPCLVFHITAGERENALIKNIAYGLEEEAVPFIIEYIDQPQPLLLMAFEAAQRSVFNVGIAFSLNGAVVHHCRFPLENPPITLGPNPKPHQARLLGNNAARLLKGKSLL